jgi:hypothetical protein
MPLKELALIGSLTRSSGVRDFRKQVAERIRIEE